MGHFCLIMLLASPKCMGHVWGRLSQKMRDMVIFQRDRHHFCLRFKQKSWMLVGMHYAIQYCQSSKARAVEWE